MFRSPTKLHDEGWQKRTLFPAKGIAVDSRARFPATTCGGRPEFAGATFASRLSARWASKKDGAYLLMIVAAAICAVRFGWRAPFCLEGFFQVIFDHRGPFPHFIIHKIFSFM